MAEKNEHFRAPLLWLLVPYMVGLSASPLAEHRPGVHWLGLGLILALGGALTLRTRGAAGQRIWATCMAGGALLLGVERMQSVTVTPDRWRELPPRELTLDVEIIRVFPPNMRKTDASALALVRRAPRVAADLVGARVYVSRIKLPDDQPVIRSQVLEVSGVIESIFLDPRSIGRTPLDRGTDSFRDFLISNAVYFRLTRCRGFSEVHEPTRWNLWRASLGERFATILSAGLPENNAAAGAYLAMFLGRKDALTEEQKLDYLQTGAMHLFAISGLHIAAIAACMHGILRLIRMPEMVRAALGILALIAFVEATGGTPSARRALVMVGLVWVGFSLRRSSNPIASIATAAFAVLILDPLALRSISFQFSYSVVAMLLLYCAPLTNLWLSRWHPWAHIPDPEWRWWHRFIFFRGRQFITLTCTSWSAALISTPLTVAYFGLASPGAVVANLALVPVALYTIMAGFASMISGLCGVTGLSVVFNHAAAMLLTAMNTFAQFAADWPGMFFEGNFTAPWIAPSLVVGMLLLCLTGYALRWSRMPGGFILPSVAMIAATVLLVTPAPPTEESLAMKSAYELAMERLQRSEPDSGKPLTQEQKERLAEIDRVFQGKVAEREIFLNQRLAEARARGELEEAEKIRQQIASERARLEEDRESEKEQVRRAGTSRR